MRYTGHSDYPSAPHSRFYHPSDVLCQVGDAHRSVDYAIGGMVCGFDSHLSGKLYGGKEMKTIRRGVRMHHNWYSEVAMKTINEVVTIVDNPRNMETGCYCRATDPYARVMVRGERSNYYDVYCKELSL